MIKWGLSELGKKFENSLNYHTSFKVKNITIKYDLSIHVSGTIKTRSDKNISKNQYIKHVKSELVRATKVSIPISVKHEKNTFNVYFKSVSKILFESEGTKTKRTRTKRTKTKRTKTKRTTMKKESFTQNFQNFFHKFF